MYFWCIYLWLSITCETPYLCRAPPISHPRTGMKVLNYFAAVDIEPTLCIESGQVIAFTNLMGSQFNV